MPAPTQTDTSWQVQFGTPMAMTGQIQFNNIGAVQTSYDAALTFAAGMAANSPVRIVGVQSGNFVQLVDGTG